jgi:hypothetical protein
MESGNHEEDDRSWHCSSPSSEQAADQYPNQHCADHALRGMCGDAFLGFIEKLCDLSFASPRS